MDAAATQNVAVVPQGRLAVWLIRSDLLGLAASTGLVAVGLLARVRHTHRGTLLFLLWNLVLAWLPALVAQFGVLAWRRHRSRLFVGAMAILWLALLPNAPYVITDLIHLRPAPDVPLWFDAGLLFAAGWTGLLLGFHSLESVHRVVSAELNSVAGALLAIVCLSLCAVGVQLGRFERWNSWDLLKDPSAVLGAVGRALTDSGARRFEFFFTALLICGYWAWMGSRRRG